MKDRAALNMMLDGERSGKLNHNRTILDATSGNTGIAYAMIGANRGYKVKLVLPANACEERKRILKAYGAETVFSDPDERLRRRHPPVSARSTWKIPTATSTPISTTIPPTGRRTSKAPGPEIIQQTNGRSPTSSPPWAPAAPSPAVTRRLQARLAGSEVLSAQPSSGFHGLEGLKHMPTAIVPGHL